MTPARVIPIAEQIRELEETRAARIRSLEWRRARRGFHQRFFDEALDRLDAAIATLKALEAGR